MRMAQHDAAAWRKPGQAIREGAAAGLAAAIIEQAWADLGMPMALRSLANRVTRKDHDEARAFLTSAAGPWAQARADWCGAAGIDPDQLRRRALARLGLPA